ncbi:MAG: hypothetical protein DPW18_07520 [Chloroflexi bacterium]|nr:hypothetical protein [Chloroflexota bacterium]MDL1941513.1 DUF58 domain-containing protein [Chloroflexi bacterium CFX2]
MKAGRILVALMLVVGLVGVFVNGAPLYSRFLFLGLLLLVTAWAWTRWAALGLHLERSSRELRANVGDVFEENYKIQNRGILPVPWIEVANQTSLPFAAGSRLLTLMMGRQRRSYTARTWLTRRGSFQLGPTRLSTGDPFGLFTAGRVFPPHETLIVFPMIHEIQKFASPPGLLPGGQVIRRKSQDITPHAAGVREYVHGDAMKRIHWPTSIRRGRLMVKEFEQDPQAEIWIYLDCQKIVHFQNPHREEDVPLHTMLFTKRPKINLPPSTLEYSVSAAASLAHYFIGQRRAIGYASAGQTFTELPAERSERQEEKILETLAFVEANGSMSIAALVAAQASQLPQRSSIILITPTVLPDLLQAVDDLLMRYLSPMVVLLDAQTFGGPTGTDALVNSLRERRVPVSVIACGDDLSQALSAVSSAYTTQDYRAWQTPAYSPLT